MKLTDFVIPPDDVPQAAQKAVKHWSQWIDYWAVDWGNKGDTFHNEWQTYRTRKDPALALEAQHTYDAPGEYTRYLACRRLAVFQRRGGDKGGYAKTFLLIAPNVIVFERLRTDFEGGRIFLADPIIPDELRVFCYFQCYMRGERERASSLGTLYLTSIQQLYERPARNGEEPEVMTAVLGSRPPADKLAIQDFDQRISARGGPVVVLNDEAHHTHDRGKRGNKVIRRLHTDVAWGVAAQLDFSATPRHREGKLFSWTVFDYPLKQAIIDNVVKRPLKTAGFRPEPRPKKAGGDRRKRPARG